MSPNTTPNAPSPKAASGAFAIDRGSSFAEGFGISCIFWKELPTVKVGFANRRDVTITLLLGGRQQDTTFGAPPNRAAISYASSTIAGAAYWTYLLNRNSPDELRTAVNGSGFLGLPEGPTLLGGRSPATS